MRGLVQCWLLQNIFTQPKVNSALANFVNTKGMTFQEEYQAGKTAFERGEYNLSIKHLEKASELRDYPSREGGEARVWLVTAYHAANRESEAIALCNKLKTHPQYSVRQQSKRLAEIINAPKLKRPQEWMTKIPDLTQVSDSNAENRYVKALSEEEKSRSWQAQPEIDLSTVEREDPVFLWAAMVLCIILGTVYFIFAMG